MTGAEACTIVPVEILIEKNEVVPHRVFLELLGASIDWTAAIFSTQKDLAQTGRNLPGYLIEIHHPARTRRTLNPEVVAEVGVVLEKRSNDQRVDRHPDRPAPVRITAKHPGRCFGRHVPAPKFSPPHRDDVRVVSVITRKRTNAIRTQEFVLIEHPVQHASQSLFIQDRCEMAASFTNLYRIVN